MKKFKRNKQRIKLLRDFIFSSNINILCRLDEEKYKNTFTRNRKISCSDLLLMTLNKQGKTTSFEIRDFLIRKKGEKKVMYTDEAYLKQRRHLNPEVFKIMNKVYLEDFYKDKKYVERKKGYLILAIDGSKEEIPNTPQNREEFGCTENSSGTNVARALLSSIYDVINKFYIDIEIDRYTEDETKLAKKNIEKMLEIIKEEDIIIIFDRVYPALDFYYWLKEKGIKFLMRMKKSNYKKEVEEMQTKDEDIKIKYTADRLKRLKKNEPEIYNKLKEEKEGNYRITKVKLEKDTEEILISNIPVEEFSSEELKELYWDRWKIERAYDSTKNKLKIEFFTGNLPIFIYQDIYAQTLVYNQISDMVKEGNEKVEEQCKNRKLEYKINENKAIGIYKESYIKIMMIENESIRAREYDRLIEEMEKYTTALKEEIKRNPRKWNCTNKYRTNYKPSF